MELFYSQDEDLPSPSLSNVLFKTSVNRLEKKHLSERDKEEILKLIKRHPYFKNPCNYHIRLVTIMKYLKRKDVDVNLPDADLVIDELIASIDGVERLEYGRYYRKKS